MNKEILEREHLQDVLQIIKDEIKHKEEQIDGLLKEMKELTHHFSEEYYFLDDEETVVGGDEMDDNERVINLCKLDAIRLKKQLYSPYFGKITFKADDENNFKDYYIGIFSLTNNNLPIVCDWRAPISSMYYDYELGRASYLAPDGKIEGEISSKRQFKIKNQEMELCFDSSITIVDDILQKELAKNANDKMKNIVSTIQKEQNVIIRNEEDNVMFVQGVAGSGKTSIALHKVAYLLYSHREKLKSSDILIISPNNIFSDYISNVLPELGEQNILQTSFYTLASDELVSLVPILETREECLDGLANDKSNRLNEVAYKNSFEFCDSLKDYLSKYVSIGFNGVDIKVGEKTIKKDIIEQLFNYNYKDKSPAVRVSWIADYILDQLELDDQRGVLYPRILKLVYPMLKNANILEIYSAFLNLIGLKFSLTQQNKIKNEDIAPILYIKNFILGLNKQLKVKYLVIDEMQDYSPLQFEMFNEVYDCKKAILGDIYQCIEKIISEEDLNKICSIVGAKKVLKLNKTYRSTYEITEFCDNLKKLTAQKVARHGEEPTVEVFNNIISECKKITEYVKKSINYETIAIICKTTQDAQRYYEYLSEIDDLELVDENSKMSRVMVMPACLSKGLEFDEVIITDASDENYNNFMDKNLIYVSCTRALHELHITAIKSASKFLKFATE